eukprot:scaffold287_cov337-Pavlova_lutheri.AAC.70
MKADKECYICLDPHCFYKILLSEVSVWEATNTGCVDPGKKSMSIPARNRSTAKMRNAFALSSSCPDNKPINKGPVNPPRLPHEFIAATPTAAPLPTKKVFGRLYNGPYRAQTPAVAIEMTTMRRNTPVRCGTNTKLSAPRNVGTKMCIRLSLVIRE